MVSVCSNSMRDSLVCAVALFNAIKMLCAPNPMASCQVWPYWPASSLISIDRQVSGDDMACTVTVAVTPLFISAPSPASCVHTGYSCFSIFSWSFWVCQQCGPMTPTCPTLSPPGDARLAPAAARPSSPSTASSRTAGSPWPVALWRPYADAGKTPRPRAGGGEVPLPCTDAGKAPRPTRSNSHNNQPWSEGVLGVSYYIWQHRCVLCWSASLWQALLLEFPCLVMTGLVTGIPIHR